MTTSQGPGPLLTEPALAAAYLRRLGFSEGKAAQLASCRPLAQQSPASKELLCQLIQQHVLRVPFENLEQHPLPSVDGSPGSQPVPVEERLARLRDARLCAERVALGARGGFCFDLNPAFAWLLRQLGATARLAMARLAQGEGFTPEATHVLVLVDNCAEAALLVDPGLWEPPRTAVSLQGGLADDGLVEYEVLGAGEAAPDAFGAVLRRRRGAASAVLCPGEPEGAGPQEAQEGEWAPVYAFRPGDDLAFGAEELLQGLTTVLTPGATIFSSGRLLCQALPAGHVVLSERRLRRVEAGGVAEELAVDGEAAWRRLAGDILALPLLSPPPGPEGAKRLSDAGDVERISRLGSLTTPVASEQMMKAFQSQEAAASKAKNLGTVDSKSLAVGGAGAGGGLGLNRPGFGPKVTHFAGGGKGKTINISPDVPSAWAQVMDDKDPIGWVFCEYSSDGKTLEMTSKGEGGLKVFKEQLGETIAWGGFRCYGVDKRGGLECKRPKLVFVQYKPEAASHIKKAKQGSHKGDVKEALAGAHLDVIVEGLGDLDEEALIMKLQSAAGAHKPNGYEFEEGNFVEADFYALGIGKDCKGETCKN